MLKLPRLGPVLACALAFAGPGLAQKISLPDPALDRLAEEADAFSRLAPKIIGRETLHHTGRAAAPRVKWLSKKKAPEVTYLKTTIVSEYGFGYFAEAPDALREFRQVVSVDGRARLQAATRDARQVLAENLTSDDDLLRRRLHEEFESHGQVGSATDFGQLILLFQRRSLPLFEFSNRKNAEQGGELYRVIHWKQLQNVNSLAIYSSGRLQRIPMEGEVWLRLRDLMPMRITVQTPIEEDDIGKAIYRAQVDYSRSHYGLLLPASVHLEKKAKSLLLIDNRSEYADYQMFGAASDIVFDAEGSEQGPER